MNYKPVVGCIFVLAVKKRYLFSFFFKNSLNFLLIHSCQSSKTACVGVQRKRAVIPSYVGRLPTMPQ